MGNSYKRYGLSNPWSPSLHQPELSEKNTEEGLRDKNNDLSIDRVRMTETEQNLNAKLLKSPKSNNGVYRHP